MRGKHWLRGLVTGGLRRQALLACTWLALLAQLIGPSLCAAAPAHADFIAICTADGTRYLPVSDNGPVAPARDQHDFCGICCFSCHRAGLVQRIAALLPPPPIVADAIWAEPGPPGVVNDAAHHHRPPGRAPPHHLV